MEEIRKGNDEYAAKGEWITHAESFEIFFGLKLAHLILSASEQFSTNIQAKDTPIQEATHGANHIITHYQSLRAESKFDRFYDDFVELSTDLTDEPSLPRYQKRPRRADESILHHIIINHLRRGTGIFILKRQSISGTAHAQFAEG